MAEVALRWMSHHSLMEREYEDAILIGASSTNHIEQVRAPTYTSDLQDCTIFFYLHRTWLTSRKDLCVRFHVFSPIFKDFSEELHLAAEVVQVLDATWPEVQPFAVKYFR